MRVAVPVGRLLAFATAVVGVSFYGSSEVGAAIIASDSFVIGASGYTADTQLLGQNPTITGFTGAWGAGSTLFKPVATGGDTIEIDQTGLTAPTQNRRANRSLSAYTTSSTYYFSGSVSAPALATGQAVMRFVDTNGSMLSAGQFGIGFGIGSGGIIGYFRNTSNTVAAVTLQANPTADTFYNIVAKVEVDQTGTSDRITFWIDPTSDAEGGAGTPVLTTLGAAMGNDSNRAVDQLWLESNSTPNASAIRFDSPRFGTAWEDVVVVPEPTLLSAAALAGICVGARRRSARR